MLFLVVLVFVLAVILVLVFALAVGATECLRRETDTTFLRTAISTRQHGDTKNTPGSMAP